MTLAPAEPPPGDADPWTLYRLRWKRRRLLWRAFRARHALTPVADRTAAIRPGAILCLATVRNEGLRLPEFLDHHRRLGVDQFLIVDHASTDGSAEWLAGQADVSLWRATGGYRASRFGMDWLGWLLMRHGHGHWCLTVDADELLVYPHHDRRGLRALTGWMDARGIPALGALMLELYPQASLGAPMAPGATALDHLQWFDAGPYRTTIRLPRRNRCTQGGMRERMFFADRPARGPTLNKLPLVRWHRSYAYFASTHQLLPRQLNEAWNGPGDPRLSGAVLHTKMLPDIVARSAEERQRRQHFERPQDFDGYHAALAEGPVVWNPQSVRYQGWRQLVDLGLMGTGDWDGDG